MADKKTPDIEIKASVVDTRSSIKQLEQDLRRSKKNAAGLLQELDKIAKLSRSMQGKSFLSNIRSVTAGTPAGQAEKALASGRVSNIQNTETQQAFRILNAQIKSFTNSLKGAALDLKRTVDVSAPQGRQAQKQRLAELEARSSLAQYRQTQDKRLTKGVKQTAADLVQYKSNLADVLKLEKEQNRTVKERLSLNARILRTAQSIKLNAAEGNILEQKKSQLKMQELLTQREQVRNGGNLNASIRKRVQITKQLRTEVEAIQRAQGLERTKQAVGDRIGADGGAFMLQIQSRLMANYLVMNKMFDLIQFGKTFVVELDRAFFQLQAITATTNTEMVGLKTTLEDVSTETKFTAVQVAEAATILGQAGFSTGEIEKSIQAITLLATATGTDLPKAVDLVTSALNVFDMQASEATNVANVFTSAVNNSKLTIDKLALGVQYAGNIAAQSGVTFSELTSILGAMANAGIRSGSMMGTGLRQVLIALQSPSEKLKERLELLGLTMEDINLRSQGMAGVMRNLKQAGFSVSDAMEVLETRAGAAFAAISGNVDAMEKLHQITLLTNAATEANAIQMQSLANKSDQAASVMGTLIVKMAGPLTKALKLALDGFTSVGKALAKWPNLLTAIGGALTTIIGGGILVWVAKLALGIGRLTGLFSAFSAALVITRTAAAGAATSVGALGMVMRLIPGLALVGGLTALATYLYSVSNEADTAAEKLDKLTAAVDKADDAVNSSGQSVGAIDKELKRLSDRYVSLSGDQGALRSMAIELTTKFSSLGGVFDLNASKVETLQEELLKLKQRMLEIKGIDLQQLSLDLKAKIEGQREKTLDVVKTGTRRVRTIEGPTGPVGNRLRGDLSAELIGIQAKLSSGTLDQQKLDETLNQLLVQNKSLVDMQRDPSLNKAQQKFLSDLSAEVKKITDAVLSQMSLGIKLDLQKQQQAKTSLDLDPGQQAIQRGLEVKNAPSLRALKSSGAKGGQTSEYYTEIARNARRIIQETTGEMLTAEALALQSGVGQTTFEAGQVSNLVAEQNATLRNIISEALKNAYEASKLVTEKQITRDTKAIKRLSEAATKRTVLSELEGLLEEIDNIAVVRQKRILENLRKKYGAGKIEGDLNELLNEASELEKERVLSEKQSLEKRIAEIKHLQELKDSETTVNFTKLTAQARAAGKTREYAAGQPLRTHSAQTQMMNSLEARDKFSDVQRLAHREDRMKLEVDLMEAQLTSKTQELIDQQKILHDLKTFIAKEQGKQIGYIDTIKRDPSKASATQAQSKLGKSQQTVATGLQNVETMEAGLAQTSVEVSDLTDKLEILNETSGETAFSFSEGFSKALSQYRQEMGLTKTVTAQFADSVKSVMGSMSNSIGQSAMAILTRTKSIGEAFKDMAKNILAAIMQMMVNKMAASIIGSVFSMFAGSGMEQGEGFGSGDAFRGRNEGGYIRAAAGRSMPMRNRDSVKTLLRPGEFVMRNSAVETIGRDNLERMNAMGPRTISQGKGVRMPEQDPNKEVAQVNVWMVPQDQVPPPSAKDIIAHVTTDMAQGGATKKMVKQIMVTG
jgi:TP901 family phage tail tape measure protein